MATPNLSNLPSLRRQQLLSEFAGLKQACPQGVFVTLTPGDSTVWLAVLFVRDGPYAPAIARFQILFPDSYPQRPPVVMFASDIFHPLITPLTTYMYTTDIQDNGTVSATDDERLPPGGFSLRHGFPEWFGKARRDAAEARRTSGEPGRSPILGNHEFSTPKPSSNSGTAHPQAARPVASLYQILKYIKSTFDNAEVLDNVPLDAAGNPGAWHAWRTHRRKLGKLSDDTQPTEAAAAPSEPPQSPKKPGPDVKKGATSNTIRRPGEWNWDGVWEDRVKKGVAASLSEPVLYGGATINDELIRFLAMDETEIESVKDNMQRTLGSSV